MAGKNYTVIPNKVFDLSLNLATFKVLIFIFKWKNSDKNELSLTFIQNGTGISRSSVSKALKELEDKKCILINRKGTINVIRPNLAFFELKGKSKKSQEESQTKTTKKSKVEVRTKNITSAEEAFGPLR